MDVDTVQHLNQSVPFMNQNQGVYLKIWATDGYNPYQRVSQMGSVRNVVLDSFGLIGLDGEGEWVKGGVLTVGKYTESAMGMAFSGIEVNPCVKSLVLLQNPTRHWHLTSGGRELTWRNYHGQGIQMAVVDEFRLRYQPKYLSEAIFIVWKSIWLILAVGLIINGIQHFRKARP